MLSPWEKWSGMQFCGVPFFKNPESQRDCNPSGKEMTLAVGS
jgi:hypothetical protein